MGWKIQDSVVKMEDRKEGWIRSDSREEVNSERQYTTKAFHTTLTQLFIPFCTVRANFKTLQLPEFTHVVDKSLAPSSLWRNKYK